MKLVRGEAINWGAVKGLIGEDAQEVDAADDLEGMLAMTYESTPRVNEGDWPLIDIESRSKEEQEDLASFSALAERHDPFSHISPGLWNHPLNLSNKSVSQILLSLGFAMPEAIEANASGRVQGWPA